MLWRMQEDVGVWSRRNFPGNTEIEPLLGVGEEYGELLHAVLKGRQGIRGSAEEHLASEKDAIGDLTIYLLDYCARRGFDLQEILEQTWEKVRRRDWVADPVAGGMGGPEKIGAFRSPDNTCQSGIDVFSAPELSELQKLRDSEGCR